MYEKGENYSDQAKYVADILSGMASVASVASTTYSVPATAFVSGITSTPTLTPTTLANIERTFIELQAVPAGVNASTGQNPHTQSGFVPPIVDPVSTSDRSTDTYEYEDPDWVPGAKRPRMDKSLNLSTKGDIAYQTSESGPGRKRRNMREEKLTPEEEERRRVRRERNKVAAAKCRQRRVDHTNRLQDETEVLESEKEELEAEIQSLQQQKDQLEFLLQAHRPLCKREEGGSVVKSVSAAPAEKVKVKSETISTTCTMDSKTNTSSAGMRPMTLNIKREKSDITATTATGIPITTPSSGFYFTMDMDHTGLTPITNGPSTCSSEANRTTSESSADTVNSPTLISL